MRLTVDASVVVKWYVPEDLAANARLLRAHRLELHAPDFLLAEFANVIWKKSRRKEISDVAGHLDEISRLPENISLRSMSSLIGRASRISLALDHPVYDCLYLACAEETSSPLVTADQTLANEVSDSALDITVRHVGSADFADDIGAAGTAPVITRETVANLVEAYRLLEATREALRRERKDGFEVLEIGALETHRDSAARRRLVTLLRGLSEEERIDLLALGWLGRPDGWDWKSCFETACGEIDTAHDNYLIRNGQFWQRGYERLFDVAL